MRSLYHCIEDKDIAELFEEEISRYSPLENDSNVHNSYIDDEISYGDSEEEALCNYFWHLSRD